MNGFTSAEATTIQILNQLQQQMAEVSQNLVDPLQLNDLKEEISELRELVHAITAQKDFYSTREVAELMGVTQHTVQVRWCADGRIQCEKDPATGRWRIPGAEYDRLRRGGRPDG